MRTPEGDDARASGASTSTRRTTRAGSTSAALKHAFGEAGFSIWDRWSQKSAKYPGATKAAKKWASFNPNGSLKLGTVFELAKRAGYSPPPARPRADSGALPPSGAAGSGGAGEPGDGRPVIRWVAGSCLRSSTRPRTRCSRTASASFGAAVSRARDQARRAERSQLRAHRRCSAWSRRRSFLTGAFERRALAQVQRQERRLGGLQRPRAGRHHLPRAGRAWNCRSSGPRSARQPCDPMGPCSRRPAMTPTRRAGTTPAASSSPRSRTPDIEAARDALALFAGAFSTFPFESETDRAVALALALTALVRRSLPSAPLARSPRL